MGAMVKRYYSSVNGCHRPDLECPLLRLLAQQPGHEKLHVRPDGNATGLPIEETVILLLPPLHPLSIRGGCSRMASLVHGDATGLRVVEVPQPRLELLQVREYLGRARGRALLFALA